MMYLGHPRRDTLRRDTYTVLLFNFSPLPLSDSDMQADAALLAMSQC